MGFIRLLFHNNKNVIRHIIRKKTNHAFREETKINNLEIRSGKSEVFVNKETIAALERVSLVDFNNEGGIESLESAIDFVKSLKELKIDSSVEPMYSVLENESLYLREDINSNTIPREKVLAHAQLLDEEYFVAPPGNVPRKT
ncbi:glutamyl-tRNA(Gln) amidotransferase subunit C, mitochondrial [Leptopilina boulardi]|uniref:glutamyl-tRNA(Gln) amidotransferase subunit C, mitochondrial n=1 Tax=Leptopilina boulardi TaxID=63433 RepID=UPI0021F625E5|nr:glutamyl-tRNA(Gln) amidotransferase subunit C, mitochondrial [Leptopilina boulardi]